VLDRLNRHEHDPDPIAGRRHVRPRDLLANERLTLIDLRRGV
jgi:hypothetical protein